MPLPTISLLDWTRERGHGTQAAFVSLLFESKHCLIVLMLMARLQLETSDGCKGYGLQLYSSWCWGGLRRCGLQHQRWQTDVFARSSLAHGEAGDRVTLATGGQQFQPTSTLQLPSDTSNRWKRLCSSTYSLCGVIQWWSYVKK